MWTVQLHKNKWVQLKGKTLLNKILYNKADHLKSPFLSLKTPPAVLCQPNSSLYPGTKKAVKKGQTVTTPLAHVPPPPPPGMLFPEGWDFQGFSGTEKAVKKGQTVTTPLAHVPPHRGSENIFLFKKSKSGLKTLNVGHNGYMCVNYEFSEPIRCAQFWGPESL